MHSRRLPRFILSCSLRRRPQPWAWPATSSCKSRSRLLTQPGGELGGGAGCPPCPAMRLLLRSRAPQGRAARPAAAEFPRIPTCQGTVQANQHNIETNRNDSTPSGPCARSTAATTAAEVAARAPSHPGGDGCGGGLVLGMAEEDAAAGGGGRGADAAAGEPVLRAAGLLAHARARVRLGRREQGAPPPHRARRRLDHGHHHPY